MTVTVPKPSTRVMTPLGFVARASRQWDGLSDGFPTCERGARPCSQREGAEINACQGRALLELNSSLHNLRNGSDGRFDRKKHKGRYTSQHSWSYRSTRGLRYRSGVAHRTGLRRFSIHPHNKSSGQAVKGASRQAAARLDRHKTWLAAETLLN